MTSSCAQRSQSTTLSPDCARLAARIADNPREVLVEQLTLINAVVRGVARRYRCSTQDADDLNSSVLLHLMQNDFSVLRQYSGRAAFRTYLFVIATRLCLDHHNREWGKWRASAKARRMGPVAVRLERAIRRDRQSIDAACATLVTEGTQLTHAQADEILKRLPSRVQRRYEPDEQIAAIQSTEPAPDAELWSEQGRVVSSMLRSALMRLGDAERRLIKMRFRDRVSVADIARADGVNQKALYRRFDSVLGLLRNHLERRGVRAYL